LRKDMGRVIVERPRGGLREKHCRRIDPREDWDDLPSRGHMGRNWHVDPRDLGDHLAPLRRFLERSVGRRWDDVWAEINRATDYRNVKGNHLLEHVRGFVYTDPNEWRAAAGRFAWNTPHGLYVDDDGVLRHKRRPKRRRRIHEAQEFGVVEVVYRQRQIRLIDGEWWDVRLGPIDGDAVGKVDAVTGEVVRLFGLDNMIVRGCLYEQRGLWAASKRRLTKEELAAAGLRKVFA